MFKLNIPAALNPFTKHRDPHISEHNNVVDAHIPGQDNQVLPHNHVGKAQLDFRPSHLKNTNK